MFHGLYLIVALIGFTLVNGLSSSQNNASIAHVASSNDNGLYFVDGKKKSTKKQVPFFDIENPLHNAMVEINTVLKNETTKPYSVSCTYKIQDKKLLASRTKINYKEYRKQPHYEHIIYDDKKPDETITFVYKPQNRNRIIQVKNDMITKQRSVKQINFPGNIQEII